MKSLTSFTLLIIFSVMIFTAGCVGAPIKIDTALDQKYDPASGRKITASASGFQLMLLIPIMINSRQARAYEELLQRAGRDYVTDIKISESWTYAYVGTVYTTTLEATAYTRIP